MRSAMPQRVGTVLVLLAIGLTAPPARADDPLNAAPFARTPCAVGEGPCTPSFCGVFNDGPCVPDTPFPYGSGDLRLTIVSKPMPQDAARYRRPDHDLDTLGDLYAMLRSCWTPPVRAEAREGMQMSVRFAFRRSGEIIAKPAVTYVSPGAPNEVRDRYRGAIDDALTRCVPLPLTKGLGNAIAGKPINIRFVDNRELGSEPTP